ncbi:MAG: hypothetical protein DBX47_05925 [Clostridiales bacterium]|nr:MAG: hypothetical protein DBX47_05925 [Clostridiales bacterium]
MSIKMKTLSCVLVLVLLTSTSVIATSAQTEAAEWNYYNSIEVFVTVDEEKIFTPEDFLEVDCLKVLVTEKEAYDEFKYRLIIVLNQFCDDEEIEAAVNAIAANPIVILARRNTFAPFESKIELNESRIKLKVGEKFDLKITDEKLYSTGGINNSLTFILDPQIYDINNIEFDIFSGYGVIIENQAKNIDGEPANLFNASTSDESRFEIIETINSLSHLPGIKYINFDYLSSGARPTEAWVTSDKRIVDFTEDQSSYESVLSVGKTVTVEGLNVGMEEISVTRTAAFVAPVTASCIVTVYLPGDLTEDGEVTLEDAMTLFRYIAGKTTLGQNQSYSADMNEDNEIRLDDAMIIFKQVAGK